MVIFIFSNSYDLDSPTMPVGVGEKETVEKTRCRHVMATHCTKNTTFFLQTAHQASMIAEAEQLFRRKSTPRTVRNDCTVHMSSAAEHSTARGGSFGCMRPLLSVMCSGSYKQLNGRFPGRTTHARSRGLRGWRPRHKVGNHSPGC